MSVIILDLTRKGYYVFTPAVTENCPYDLIADDGNRLWKIQVKYRSDGTIPKSTSWSDRNQHHRKCIDPNSFDIFAIVNKDRIAYCPIEMAGTQIVFDTKQYSKTVHYYWYEDFCNLSTIVPIQRISQQNRKATRNRSTNSKNAVPKIEWPDDATLHDLIWKMPTTKVALMLGVSDVAIQRRCRQRSITKPPRGYWTPH